MRMRRAMADEADLVESYITAGCELRRDFTGAIAEGQEEMSQPGPSVTWDNP